MNAPAQAIPSLLSIQISRSGQRWTARTVDSHVKSSSDILATFFATPKGKRLDSMINACLSPIFGFETSAKRAEKEKILPQLLEAIRELGAEARSSDPAGFESSKVLSEISRKIILHGVSASSFSADAGEILSKLSDTERQIAKTAIEELAMLDSESRSRHTNGPFALSLLGSVILSAAENAYVGSELSSGNFWAPMAEEIDATDKLNERIYGLVGLVAQLSNAAPSMNVAKSSSILTYEVTTESEVSSAAFAANSSIRAFSRP